MHKGDAVVMLDEYAEDNKREKEEKKKKLDLT